MLQEAIKPLLFKLENGYGIYLPLQVTFRVTSAGGSGGPDTLPMPTPLSLSPGRLMKYGRCIGSVSMPAAVGDSALGVISSHSRATSRGAQFTLGRPDFNDKRPWSSWRWGSVRPSK